MDESRSPTLSRLPSVSACHGAGDAMRLPHAPCGIFASARSLFRDAMTSNIRLVYLARGVRGFGDGFAIIVLPAYLAAVGYSPAQIGIVAAASLLGTALLTLAVGAIAVRRDVRAL